MVSFKKGQIYDHVSWFTGGQQYYEVKSVRGGKVHFDVTAYEIDGTHRRKECFDLKEDEHGQYVLLFTYHGEECVIRAVEEKGVA